MKTLNVIIVCITAVICTALISFAVIRKNHGCHKREKGCHRPWMPSQGGASCCASGQNFSHEEQKERGGWEHHEKGEWGQHKGDFDPAKAAERHTEFLKEELVLSADQVTKVQAINLKYAEKMKVVKDQFKTQRETIHTEKTKELSSVLTKEQMEKLEQCRRK